MKKGKEENKKKNNSGTEKSKSFFSDERIRFVVGILITGFAVYLLFAFIAYLFYWKEDQSQLAGNIADASVQVKNWSGKSGAWFARLIIRNGFGLGAFFIPMILGSIGLYMLKFPKIRLWKLTVIFTFATIIVSLILGYISGEKYLFLGSGMGGAQGYEATKWLNAFMGKLGTGILLLFITVSYLVYALNVSPSAFAIKLPEFLKIKKTEPDPEVISDQALNPEETKDTENPGEDDDEAEGDDEPFQIINKTPESEFVEDDEGYTGPHPGGSIIHDLEETDITVSQDSAKIPINITKAEADDQMSEQEVQKIMENYDPRLDLSRYKFPPVSILKEHKSSSAFDNAEVIENKENIIKTLGDHKIPIKHISATVGPTVTLYEIVPERGVRLARIKSLENDIALNLSALGIRIIAPIPGRGTVGIEVPNKNPEMVSMRSLITSKAFQETKFDIALALGRTITNDAYIVDLTKMPHLLVAGATGQGKSVGINAIITSIL
jgi:DNA segregation ATPase FtsK/SpoIIIE, S-DNA-T family